MSARRRLAVATAMLALFSAALAQPEVTSGKATPKPDPKATPVIRQMCDYIKAARGLSVEASYTLMRAGGGQKIEMNSTVKLAARRPNLLSATWAESGARAEVMTCTLISDGKDLYMSIPLFKQYTVSKAPADLGAIFNSKDAIPLVYRVPLFLDTLLANDPYETLMEDVLSTSYAGSEDIEGGRYDHVKFALQDVDWDLWVASGAKPLPLKVILDLTRSLKRMQGAPADIRMTIRFEKWAINPDLPDDRFRFVPAEGAKKVASFEEPATVPLGQPAPDFTLPLLDGGQVTLSQQKGKIVILDFWATWCGPCQQSMPIIESAATAYKDKGVVLYAVNQDEAAATVREFLTAQKLNVAVALDQSSTVGAKYGASSIPLTVVIGKDGTVQAVHVGFSPRLKKTLTDELDTLTAGKSLTGENK